MSLGKLKALLGLSRGQETDPCISSECQVCSATPGTVTPHTYHVLLRLQSPPDANSRTAEYWWPEKVDGDPAIVAVNAAVKEDASKLSGNVKITAFDYPLSYHSRENTPGAHDVFIFPAGVRLVGIPLDSLSTAVITVLSVADSNIPQALASIPGGSHEILQGPTAIVCCHSARDARCGMRGPPIARSLEKLGVRTILSSHVGGHQYAGNVILYHKEHSCNGNWFGGLTDASVEEFWEAVSSLGRRNAASDERLRKFWRGKSGMSKVEQVEFFESCGEMRDIEELVE